MTEPVWITERDALAIHDRLLAIHGGLSGIRDEGLLQSALARPQQHLAYSDSTDVIGMSALYTAGIIQNRPFLDRNKRTGFVCGVLFLELNGYRFGASEEDVVRAVLGVAAGEINETVYTEWLCGVTARTPSKKKQPLH